MEFKTFYNLEKTLDELNISRNKLAVEGKIRPGTLYAITNGTSKSVTLETAHKIINTIYELTGTVIEYSDIVEIKPIKK